MFKKKIGLTTDGNASFLRAARAGNLEKVLEYLKGNIDINTSNSNGLNALHLASKEGHVNVVTELLTRGANIDAATKKGNTALHIASLAGQEEIVKILVQHGAKVNIQSQSGFTPLYMAAQENKAEVVKFLLANGASQALTTADGFSPMAVALQQGHDKVVAVLLEHDSRSRVRLPALHIAAKKNDVKAATLLLKNKHEPDGQSKSGFTPLHIAAHYGNTDVAGLLIEHQADVNFKARNNITPLHVSAKWGRTNMVSLLVESKADPSSTTRDGLTPLHCGARSGHDQVVDILLEKGAPVTVKSKNGLTPLHMAAQGDHADCARILLYHKAPIDEVTMDYLTPLHVAAHCGNVKTAKLLLDKKCQVNARALNGFTPLHIACKKNRIKVVELLLKYMANLEATTESGLTPLHVASFMGHMNIVVLLIQHGANTDCQTVRGETALHLAARANQTDIIRILLRNGASVDAKAREDQTPLHIAARLGNVDNVVLLLQHGASPNAATKDLYTPLHIAAKEGHEEVASVLLDHGANSDLTTKKGFTPLHIASKYGNMKVARLLLQKDADPNAQGKNGLTPLHVATHYNHPQMALLLLENKASPHAKAKNGYTPLHIAGKKNQMEIATTLLEYKADPNAESKNGFTPLHLASQEGHTDMVSLLLEHKGDVNFRAKNGLTPMHLAAQEDHVPVAEILVKYDAQIDPQTKAGYTPLHTACHFGQINMIRFLLDHGASVNTTTKLGYTPLHQAAQQGHVLVINLLLKYKADPNAMTNNGQTPLSIAHRLGYISVVEVLKNVTDVTATPAGDEKYKVQSPETMQETLMTDSEDEGGDDTLIGDQSYQYLSTDDMKFLNDDSISPTKDDRDLQFFERYSTASSLYGPERQSTRSSSYIQEEMKYTRDSTFANEELKDTRDSADFPGTPSIDYPPVFERIDSNVDSHVEEEEKLQSVNVGQQYSAYPSKAISEDSRGPMYGSSYSGVSFASSFASDNIAINRHPVYSGFLVSFMVDARGGAMRGCRHSGVRIIVPPGKACQPTRVTCKLVKKEKLVNPPPLMEGEALASRVLEMGPNGAKFQGPVIIEVPHFASLRGKEREVVILRSDNGETWREHTLEATEDAIHEALNGSFEDLETAEDLYQKRITRILTTDFPQYFAIVTRIRQENNMIGPNGGMLSSTVVPQVQAVFPEGSLTKKIKVGLQAQPIQPEVVSKLLGNRVAVSPIVTVEPRRRKFHKPITLTIPLPKASQKGMLNQYDKGGDSTPTLRLLCSITGTTAPAQWEDITGTTVLTFVNDCVSFTTTVSARFWLMDCQNVPNCAKMASELYREAIAVPFMSKFVVFAKRHDPLEARLRVFCMTDDKMDKTLESQEHFQEVARSRDVEVQEGKPQHIEMGGNLLPVTKSGEQLSVNFHAFRENRLPMVVRIRDSNQEPVGRIAFMREPKVARGEAPQQPICNLNITLTEYLRGDSQIDSVDTDELQNKYDLMRSGTQPADESISKAELRLTDIAEALQGDWVALGRQLNITEDEITKIQSEYTYVSEQALVMLHLWVQKNRNKATGNELERALRKIGREDVIRKCMYNVEAVTDVSEQQVAWEELNQPDFDELKEELGPSRDSSLKRDMSLDVQYDEQDLMKESESAGGSETGSLPEGIDKDRIGRDVEGQDLAAKLVEEQIISESAVRPTEAMPEDEIIPSKEQAPSDDTVLYKHEDGSEELLPKGIDTLDVAQQQLILPEDKSLQEQAPVEESTVSPTQQVPEKLVPSEDAIFAAPLEQDKELSQPEVKSTTVEQAHVEEQMLSPTQQAPEDLIPSEGITAAILEQDREVTLPEFKSPTKEQAPIEEPTLSPTEQTPEDFAPSGDTFAASFEPDKGILQPEPKSTFGQHPSEEQTLSPEASRDFQSEEFSINQLQMTHDVSAPKLREPPAVDLPTQVPVTEEELEFEERTFVEAHRQRDLDSPFDEQDMIPDEASSFAQRFLPGLPPGDDIEEYEETLPDGTVVTRRISKTKVKKIVTRKIRRVGPDGEVIEDVFTEEVPDSEVLSETSSVISSTCDYREISSPVPSLSPTDLASPIDSDSERGGVRVYTDTVEGEPQVETDVQEFEETLPDGTVVRRKVIKTRQKQTIVKRVVMEGPENELPASEEQAQEYLTQAFEPGYTKYTDTLEGEPESHTDVQEFEETLEDGTVVKRRVVTTTEQQLKTERTVLEGEEIPEFDGHDQAFQAIEEPGIEADIRSERPQAGFRDYQEPIDDEIIVTRSTTVESAPQYGDAVDEDEIQAELQERKEPIIGQDLVDGVQSVPPTSELLPDDYEASTDVISPPSTVPSEGASEFVDAQEEQERDSSATGEATALDTTTDQQWSSTVTGEAEPEDDGEVQTTRVVMKKQIHKKTIIRDGKEETIVTEDTHIEQDNEGPPELRDSMQTIVDQFMEGQGQIKGPEQQ